MALPFDRLVDAALIGVWVHVDGRIVYANACGEEILGTAAGAAVGLRIADVVDPGSRELVEHRARRLLAGRRLAGSAEVDYVRPGGERVRVESVESVLDVDGAPAVVVMACDVTERSRREAHLAHLATHDGLTGLPNRLLLTDRLEQALSRARRGHGRVQLLFCDLDGFKAVNDALGHAAGDEVLRQVADRLRAAAGEADTVARLAGDEFVVCAELGPGQDPAVVPARIEAALTRPLVVEGSVVPISASVGSVVCEDGFTVGAALAEADRRMYAVKRRRAQLTAV